MHTVGHWTSEVSLQNLKRHFNDQKNEDYMGLSKLEYDCPRVMAALLADSLGRSILINHKVTLLGQRSLK